MVIDYTKCIVPDITFNGPLLPLNLDDKKSLDGKQKTTKNISSLSWNVFLPGLCSWGYQEASISPLAGKEHPLPTLSQPILERDPGAAPSTCWRWTDWLKEDKQTYSLNPAELALGTHKSCEPKENLPTAHYTHVLSTLCFHSTKVLGKTNYSKQEFPIPKLFLATGLSSEGPEEHSAQNITFVSLHTVISSAWCSNRTLHAPRRMQKYGLRCRVLIF